ncbi:MAG: hypothetical protein IT373_26360 [Polyangiaceae bacterium]|nr:hypothetical protein [Polyangiaceae bacterium]
MLVLRRAFSALPLAWLAVLSGGCPATTPEPAEPPPPTAAASVAVPPPASAPPPSASAPVPSASVAPSAVPLASASVASSAEPLASASVAPSAAPLASASASAEPVAVSRSLDLPREGPIFWVHQTPACRAAGAKGPEPQVGPPKIYTWPSSGRLPLEVIVRILRQNGARLVACFAKSASGAACRDARASLRFVIARDGRIARAEPQPDAAEPQDLELAACLARELYGLSFPQPEGGVVTVKMPLRFLR